MDIDGWNKRVGVSRRMLSRRRWHPEIETLEWLVGVVPCRDFGQDQRINGGWKGWSELEVLWQMVRAVVFLQRRVDEWVKIVVRRTEASWLWQDEAKIRCQSWIEVANVADRYPSRLIETPGRRVAGVVRDARDLVGIWRVSVASSVDEVLRAGRVRQSNRIAGRSY